MKSIPYLLTTLLLALAPFTFGAAKPNIVLIYTDDQGTGDVSALNPEAKLAVVASLLANRLPVISKVSKDVLPAIPSAK